MATIEEALTLAFDFHRSGQTTAAAQVYERILAVAPEIVIAWNNLGAIFFEEKRLEDAVACYRNVVSRKPNAPEAHYNLGRALMALNLRDHAEAALSQAVLLNPRMAEAHYLLGVLHREQKQLKRAEACLRAALTLSPDHAEIHLHLAGVLDDLSLSESRESDDSQQDAALDHYRRGVTLAPHSAAAWYNYGGLCRRLRRWGEAIAAYRQVTTLQSDNTAAWLALAEIAEHPDQPAFSLIDAEAAFQQALRCDPKSLPALARLGGLALLGRRHEQAIAFFDRALAIMKTAHLGKTAEALNMRRMRGAAFHALRRFVDAAADFEVVATAAPNNAEDQYNFGKARHDLKDWTGAEAAYRHALVLGAHRSDTTSDFTANVAMNLGLILDRQGRSTEAETVLRYVLTLRPDHLDARLTLGKTLLDQRRFAEAGAWFTAILIERPDVSRAWMNLGLTAAAEDRYDDAISCYLQSLARQPDFAGSWQALGLAYKTLGMIPEAILCYRRAVSLEPESSGAYRCLLNALMFAPGVSDKERFQEHLNFRKLCAASPHPPSPPSFGAQGRKLRIGYLSGDFRAHVVSRNLLPLFQSHDRANVEIFAYAHVGQPDAVTEMFREIADHWRDLFGIDDAAAADIIRNDQIDVLICAAGRFDDNRPLICAHRPAPVQINWFDVATSGVPEIDYVLTDWMLTPRRKIDASGRRVPAESFVEKPLYLPLSYILTPLEDAPASILETDPETVVFGSFNMPAKINHVVLTLWADLLHRFPKAQLLFKYRTLYRSPMLIERICNVFEKKGIDPQRVVFSVDDGRKSHYLSYFNMIDVALDPFPFSGSNTTFDALWMGVPVVTLADDFMVGRYSSAILTGLGLQEWVAETPEAYLEIAMRLAEDREKRLFWRNNLRQLIRESDLVNGRLRARQLERLLRIVVKKTERNRK
ncbi:protein O-GlcNAc transferase [Azospirillaceae bacterium]